MKKAVQAVLFVLALAAPAAADDIQPVPTPEINPASAVSAIALLAGGLTILRGRRKQ